MSPLKYLVNLWILRLQGKQSYLILSMMDAYKITKLFAERIQRIEQQNLWRDGEMLDDDVLVLD